MDITKDWKPRLSIDISEEKFIELQKHIPWGMKNKLFLLFADEIIRISQEHGPLSLALLARNGLVVQLKGGTNAIGGT